MSGIVCLPPFVMVVGGWGCWLTGEAELEARMLGLYKDKSLQAGEPGGEG